MTLGLIVPYCPLILAQSLWYLLLRRVSWLFTIDFLNFRIYWHEDCILNQSLLEIRKSKVINNKFRCNFVQSILQLIKTIGASFSTSNRPFCNLEKGLRRARPNLTTLAAVWNQGSPLLSAWLYLPANLSFFDLFTHFKGHTILFSTSKCFLWITQPSDDPVTLRWVYLGYPNEGFRPWLWSSSV